MRLCALRATQQPQNTCTDVMSCEGLDIVAPELLYQSLVDRARVQRASTSEHAVKIPPQAHTRLSPLPTVNEETTPDVMGHQKDEKERYKDNGLLIGPVPRSGSLGSCLLGFSEEEATCSICLEGFSAKDIVRETTCCHIVHSSCLKQWLEQSAKRCPLCQSELGLPSRFSV